MSKFFPYKTIEPLFDIGGESYESSYNEENVKNLVENTQNIDSSMRVNAMTKLLNKTINEAAQNNQSDLLQMIKSSNRISMSGSKVTGGLRVSNVTQSSTIDKNTEMEVVQDLSSKIQNEIERNLSDNISQDMSNINKMKESKLSGSSVEGAIDAVAGFGTSAVEDITGMVSDIASVSIGSDNTKIEENISNLENTVKETLNLSQPLEIEKPTSIKDDLSNMLSQENINKVVDETQQANEMDYSNMDISGGAIIENVEQVAVVNAVLKGIFKQESINEMSNKIVTNIDNIFSQVTKQIKEHESDEKVGDIVAVGEAGKALLVGAGEGIGTASVGLGEGVSTAAQGAGEGISTAAQGVGTGAATAAEGVGSMLAQGQIVFIVIGVIFVLGFMAYFLM
jgi:hypothetical protein